MKSLKNTYCAVDIGTFTTRALIFQRSTKSEQDQQPIRVLGYGESASQGLRKGVVINIEATAQGISQAILEAEKGAGQKVSEIVCSISGSHIQGFNSIGIAGIRHKEVDEHDIVSAIESARAVAIPSDREFLHILPQEFVVDSQDGIKDPLGISGVRLEARVHMITGAMNAAHNIVKCANKCGLVVSDLYVGALASSHSSLVEEERELGVCHIDIGAGTTDVVVLVAGAVQSCFVLPFAGTHITNDLATGLRTPVTAAENIKCKYGAASHAVLADADDRVEVPTTGGRESRIISRSMLCEIIEPRVSETFELIKDKLLSLGVFEQIRAGYVITGGTAKLPGIAQRAESILGQPVRVASPQTDSIVDGQSVTKTAELKQSRFESPEFSTLIGLTMSQNGVGHLQSGKSQENNTGIIKKFRHFLSQYM